ncbi:MAG: hypothetical protein ACTSR8_19870 [Promethearchaeota archaeon]
MELNGVVIMLGLQSITTLIIFFLSGLFIVIILIWLARRVRLNRSKKDLEEQ